jgi:cytochrome c2
MIRAMVVVVVSHAWSACLAADLDSARGAAVFETQGCVQCHTMNGGAGKIAPDLSRPVDRSFSPTALATTIWNHAPTMWKTIQSQGAKPPQLDEQAAGDLFAYFYSVRFFEPPGDAGRGKHVFQDRGCSGCHGLGAAGQSAGLPIALWTSIGDPVALAEAMWNHAPNMRGELAVRRKHWPHLSTQDLTDLEVFVRNSNEGRAKPSAFMIATNSEAGAALFRSKGCAECHASRIPLEKRIGGLTLTGIAAQMWNHAPFMSATPPKFEGNEMRDLLSYLWARQFFENHGDAAHGHRLFVAKRCEVCHGDASSGAPHLPLNTGKFNGISMVSALWRHGPGMLGRMQDKNIPWPRFEAHEMSDIIAYVNSGDRK